MGRKNGSPPGACATGNSPATVVKVVNKTGRNLEMQAFLIASSRLSFFSRSILIKLTNTIESLTTTPIRPTTPISAINPKARPNALKLKTTPVNPRGIASMITIGCHKLPNMATRIKKIQTIEISPDFANLIIDSLVSSFSPPKLTFTFGNLSKS